MTAQTIYRLVKRENLRSEVVLTTEDEQAARLAFAAAVDSSKVSQTWQLWENRVMVEQFRYGMELFTVPVSRRKV